MNTLLIVKILDALIPFKKHMTTTTNVKAVIKDIDLEGLREEILDFQNVSAAQKTSKPTVVENTASLTPGLKRHYHAENRNKLRCFDEHVKKERDQGVLQQDPGSPPFVALRPAKCEECGEIIMPGDLMVIRQEKPQDKSA